jgi:hypothetical protein
MEFPPPDQIEAQTSPEEEEEPQTLFVEDQPPLHDDLALQAEAAQCSANEDFNNEEQLSNIEATDKQSNHGK